MKLCSAQISVWWGDKLDRDFVCRNGLHGCIQYTYVVRTLLSAGNFIYPLTRLWSTYVGDIRVVCWGFKPKCITIPPGKHCEAMFCCLGCADIEAKSVAERSKKARADSVCSCCLLLSKGEQKYMLNLNALLTIVSGSWPRLLVCATWSWYIWKSYSHITRGF